MTFFASLPSSSTFLYHHQRSTQQDHTFEATRRPTHIKLLTSRHHHHSSQRLLSSPWCEDNITDQKSTTRLVNQHEQSPRNLSPSLDHHQTITMSRRGGSGYYDDDDGYDGYPSGAQYRGHPHPPRSPSPLSTHSTIQPFSVSPASTVRVISPPSQGSNRGRLQIEYPGYSGSSSRGGRSEHASQAGSHHSHVSQPNVRRSDSPGAFPDDEFSQVSRQP